MRGSRAHAPGPTCFWTTTTEAAGSARRCDEFVDATELKSVRCESLHTFSVEERISTVSGNVIMTAERVYDDLDKAAGVHALRPTAPLSKPVSRSIPEQLGSRPVKQNIEPRMEAEFGVS